MQETIRDQQQKARMKSADSLNKLYNSKPIETSIPEQPSELSDEELFPDL
jgi:hypothetical protein